MVELSQQPADPNAGVRAFIPDDGETVEVYVETGASATKMIQAIALVVAPHFGQFQLRSMTLEAGGYLLLFERI